ncbi:MAG TPA: alpha/beta hydrolase [Ktedonobacterales bacterium]|nr:alpha/beta hydrolase [Ktedonobacterales bacterium]
MSETVAAETGNLDVAGGRLYYEVAGAGHPLVLLHADVADCRMWDEQFAAFARQYRVVRLDKRGFGKTVSDTTVFSHRQDIVDLLAHLGIARTAILGLSNGGALALDFTLEHPELVDALIVVSGGIGGYEEPATDAEMQIFGEYEELEKRHDIPGMIERSVHIWGDGPDQPVGRASVDTRERLRAMIADNYRLHPEELQPERMIPPAIGRLGDVHTPTLVILGGLDFTGTIDSMNVLAERVTGAEKVVFPDTAHMVNMEQPERFDAVVLEFLAHALKA